MSKPLERHEPRTDERLRQFINSLVAFVAVLDVDGHLKEVDSAALQVGGLTLEDVVGRPFWKTYWWSYDPEIQQEVQDVVRKARAGETVRYETVVRIANNGRLPIIHQMCPIYDGHGRVSELIASASDISAQKTHEKLAREHGYRAALALEAGGMGSFEIRFPEGRLIADRQFHALFDVPEGSMLGLCDVVDRIEEPERTDFESAMKDARAGTPESEEFQTLSRIIAGGQTKWLACRGKVVDADNLGEPTKVSGVVFDVTEQRRQADQRDLVNRELNHRVKNLFAVVGAVVSATLRGAPNIEQANGRVAERIAALAASHSMGLDALSTGPIQLQDIIAKVVAPHRPRGADLSVDCQSIMIVQHAITPVCMILHELATNALKYGAWAIPDGRVEVSARALGTSRIMLAWRETGSGPHPYGQGSGGFGLQLIEACTRQLAGKVISTSFDAGCDIRIEVAVA